jgi:hypothetical protein
MYKVIVERPRKGKGVDPPVARLRDHLDGPSRLGMRFGYGGRALNENLAPLRRFLQRQIGRPWNKVFSEIAACIDRRNTVQQHIYQHLDDIIATQVEWRDGELINLKGGWRVIQRSLRQKLYVDPRTGLIRPNKAFRTWAQERRAAAPRQCAEIAARRRELSADHWLMELEGQWYAVRIAPIPQVEIVETLVQHRVRRSRFAPPVYDVVLKGRVRREWDAAIEAQQRHFYGRTGWYAVSKRQLSKREIRDRELRS